MTFWFIAAALIIFVMLILLWALTRKGDVREKLSSPLADIEIYRTQLQELDRDLEKSLIDNISAEEARLEIARAILKAEKAAKADHTTTRFTSFMRVFLSVMVLLVPLCALFVYVLQGAPQMPSYPFETLMQKDTRTLSEAEELTRLEVQFMRAPSDGRTADILSLLYLQNGRFREAANTYQDAIRLNGKNAARLVGYALALTENNGGTVSQEAQDVFLEASNLAPDDFYPQYFLAEALLQSGDKDGAIKRLQTYHDRLPATSPVREKVESVLEKLQKTPKQLEEEAKNQRIVIENMVQALAARLDETPDDLEGWQQLLRSWLVLGEGDKAREALKQGMAKLSPEKAASLQTYAKAQGLTVEMEKAE